MHPFLEALFIILLYALVRSADLAIVSGLARSYIRAVTYGLVALLAFFSVAFTIFH